MFETTRSPSASMTLEAVLESLRGSPGVDGLALIGSTAREELGPASDVDLVVVAEDAADEPFEVVFTSIEGRPADVIVTTPRALDDARHEALARWLAGGRVVLDRSGAIARFLERSAVDPPPAWPDGAAYRAWWSVSFEVTKAERYLAADDASYREAGRWIATKAALEALLAYFQVRGLPWDGERKALAHWRTEDPGFFELYRDFFEGAGTEVLRRLADHALAPAGRLWAAGTGPRSRTWERLIDG